MQVVVALPSLAPTFHGKQGHCLPQDNLATPRVNSTLMALQAQLLANTYVPAIYTAEVAAAEKVPPAGIVQASYSDHPPQAQEEEDEAPASPQLRWVEPPAASVQDVEPSATSEADAQNDAPSHSLSFLTHNCDEILPSLYLGGIEAALDSEGLAVRSIRAVVCCMRELEFPNSKFNPDLEYNRVDVEDMGREPIELFFPEATEFIHTQLLQERPVLVHCKAGVSRSASVLIAYLIEYCGYSLHDAFNLLLHHRPTITPNPGFMERLRDFEKEKCGIGVPSIDIRKYVSWFQAEERCLQPDLKPD